MADPKYAGIKLIDNGVEDKSLSHGAIGDLRSAITENSITEDLLVLPSDTIVSIDLQAFVNFAKEKNVFTSAVFDTKDKGRIAGALGCVEKRNSMIIGFEEKPENPKTTITSVPIYYYPANTLHLITEYLSSGGNQDAPGSIIPWLLEQVICSAFEVTGYYYDIGTPEAYSELNNHPEVLKL